MKDSVQYLGQRIDAQGLHATDDKIKAIVDAPIPKNVQELRFFLGLLNYYGRFIANLSSLIHPLNELLHRDTPWKWTEECSSALNAAKRKIVDSNVLVHYDPNLPIRLASVTLACPFNSREFLSAASILCAISRARATESPSSVRSFFCVV